MVFNKSQDEYATYEMAVVKEENKVHWEELIRTDQIKFEEERKDSITQIQKSLGTMQKEIGEGMKSRLEVVMEERGKAI